MKTQKEQLLETLEWERKKIERKVENIEKLPIQLCVEAFSEGNWSPSWGYEFEFCLPMRFELSAQFKEFCVLQGWKAGTERQYIWDDGNAGLFFDVRITDELSFGAAFRSQKVGSTCIIKEIGKELKPIYEVICGDGAQENTFGDTQ